jgi:hypothetical protein
LIPANFFQKKIKIFLIFLKKHLAETPFSKSDAKVQIFSRVASVFSKKNKKNVKKNANILGGGHFFVKSLRNLHFI